MSQPCPNCVVKYYRGTVEYCPLHEAAPKLLRLLGLIVAEFKSDPMSVQCFDLGVIVDPAVALVEELEKCKGRPR